MFSLRAASGSGAGHESTLRLTSPHPPSVVTSVALIAAMLAFMFDFSTPWNWKLWRVVIRSVPLPHFPQMSSIARYWSAVSFPPGSLSRIMNMYALPTPALPRFLRASRSSCW